MDVLHLSCALGKFNGETCNAGNYDDVIVQMEVLPPALAHRSENVWRNRMSSSGQRPETKKSNKKTKVNNNNTVTNKGTSNNNNSITSSNNIEEKFWEG